MTEEKGSQIEENNTIIPIAPETLSGYTWSKTGNFWFTANDTACELGLKEAAKAAVNLPLAFMRNADGLFQLVSVQGFQPQENLLVSKEGRWLSNYIPAQYRFHPFILVQNDKEQLVLCFNNFHKQLNSNSDGEPFFSEENELVPIINQVFEGLVERWHGLKQAESIAKKLDTLGLITPWDIMIESGGKGIRVEGYYSVDEQKFTELNAEDLCELRDTGALALAYCQMISMNNLNYLKNLKAEKMGETSKSDGEINFALESGNDQSLNFDNL